MKISVDQDLVERARKLGPLVSDHREEADRARRPSRHVMAALREAGLFRLYTPASFGGLEVDPLTCAVVIEEVAGFDSAAGWSLMVANSVDWWCARLPAEGPEEIYRDDQDVIIAAGFHPPIQAVEVEGGFRVTGRSPLASNVHDAGWVFFTAVVEGGGGAIGLIVRAEEVEILDTWYTLGMRGTDSNDVVVSDVFVPAARTFPLQPSFAPGPRYQAPLYRFPGIGEATVVIAPTALAVARRALEEVSDVARDKMPFGSAVPLGRRSATQARLARADAVLRSARLLFHDTVGDVWDRTVRGDAATLEDKGRLLLAGSHALASAVEAVDLVWRVAGTTGIYDRSPLERHFRDIHTLQHHGFLAESRYETAGQVHLGVEPEFGLVAF